MTEHLYSEHMYWDQMQSIADDAMRMQLVSHCGAKLRKDGDSWCWIIGENLQEGVAGFGDSPRSALDNLWENFHKKKGD